MIDLRETKRIKDLINEQPNKVLETIESTKIGVCITNDKGNFVAVNEAYTKVYGYEKKELIGNSFLMVVPSETKSQMTYLHDKFIKEKREIAKQWTVERKNGELIEIVVDTGFSDQIFDQTPHKITFVQRAEDVL